MNKVELIAAVAETTGETKKSAEMFVNATLAAIEKGLVEDGKVQMVGFGSFEVKTRAARVNKNPRTGAIVNTPATKVPTFKAGKALKDAVAK